MKLAAVKISNDFDSREDSALKSRAIALLTDLHYEKKTSRNYRHIVSELLSIKQRLGNKGKEIPWPD